MSTNESAFWRFSVEFYAQPGVPDACLTLQDRHGVDVNVLLFLLYLAYRGRSVEINDVRRIDQHVHAWREQVIKPLRTLRRNLKGGIAPVAVEASDTLRSAIKREELHAERLQQEALEHQLPWTSTGAPEITHSAAKTNLLAYETITGKLPEAVLGTLLRSLPSQ